jgi:nucleotide-binding universal stress UspA family protein
VAKANQIEADFIVMGTTGASGLKEAFLGSVAAEVLENSSCPVMAVPHAARFDGKMDRIAFATDYHDLDKPTLKSAATFASWFGATLDVVHIDTTHTEPYTAGMYKFLDSIEALPNVKPFVLDHTSIEEGLVQFLEENKTDILAMRVKKRNFIQELFTYSMTKKMANHLHIPVLGLHA